MKTIKIFSVLILLIGTVGCDSEESGNTGGEISPSENVVEEDGASAQVEVNEAAQEVYDKLMDGQNFTTLAMFYSQDRSTIAQGGNIGWTVKGDLVEEYENVVYALQIDEISTPFQSEYGWHIAQLLDISGDSIRSRHILIEE